MVSDRNWPGTAGRERRLSGCLAAQLGGQLSGGEFEGVAISGRPVAVLQLGDLAACEQSHNIRAIPARGGGRRKTAQGGQSLPWSGSGQAIAAVAGRGRARVKTR